MAETLQPINPAAHNVPEYTVSEIAGAVKRAVEDRFGRVRVRGEISGWRGPHSSGHAYFRLKDEHAVLEAVCWKGSVGKIAFKLEEGLEVIATGRMTTYPGSSKYQLVIEHIEPAGIGALMALLEKRKAELMKEGLFDPARKKPLPYMPAVIGVVTSPTGAVIRDILHRIADRFPLRVLVWPVAVQGESAAAQVAEAIRGFNALTPGGKIPRPDVLIVARGGGSIEDLWAFNEEIVVRAAAGSGIPLISAVGHETDTTLIDFASDRRAPTPTAAAEMAVPVREDLVIILSQLQLRLKEGWLRYLNMLKERLGGLVRGLPKPHALLELATQRLDSWSERLAGSLPALLKSRTERLRALCAALRPQVLLKDVRLTEARLEPLSQRMQQAVLRRLTDKTQQLETAMRMLASLDYQNVLKRGFALVSSPDGHLMTTAEAARKQNLLTLAFHDGEVKAKPQ